MVVRQEEIRCRVCITHKDFLKDVLDSDWKWNTVYLLPSEPCQIEGCKNQAYWVAIGLKFPSFLPETLEREYGACRSNFELYAEARQVLGQSNALDSLTHYLYSRTPRTIRRRLFHLFASLILKELKIDANITLNDRLKHRLIDFLEILPDH